MDRVAQTIQQPAFVSGTGNVSILNVDTLKDLNNRLSKKELIDKFYTKSQKARIRRLDGIRILFLATVTCVIGALITLLILNAPSHQFYMLYMIVLVVVGLLSTIPAIWLGKSFDKLREEFGMAVLNDTFFKEIGCDYIRSVSNGLDFVRLQMFKEFCKQESITITKEFLFCSKGKLVEDLKDTKADNTSLSVKLFKAVLPFLATSFVTVCLSRLEKIEDIIIIFAAAFILVYTVGFVLFIVNTWRNDLESKRKHKYRDLLRTIESAEFELFKG